MFFFAKKNQKTFSLPLGAEHTHWRRACLAIIVLVQANAARAEDWRHFQFHHPGLLNDTAELTTIRQKIAGKAEPWLTNFRQLEAFAKLPYHPTPYADVSQGFGGANDHGFDQEMRDANAAYAFALMYTLTGKEDYAAACATILDAWAATLHSHSGPNWYLEAAWAGATWPLAAELLKSAYGGKWRGAQAFGKMLNDVFLPPLHARIAFGNREFAVINALAAIAVYNDDPAAFAEAIIHFRKYVPEFYYLRRDGETPPVPDYWLATPDDATLLAIDANRLPGTWTSWIKLAQDDDDRATLKTLHQGDDSTALLKALKTGDVHPLWGANAGAFIAGYSPETGGRDLAHAESAFGSTINTAEIARHQGIDLYGPFQDRLTLFMETVAGFRLGAAPPPSAYDGVLKPGNGLGQVYETAYDHYHNVLKLPLPETYAIIHQAIRQIPLVPYVRGQPNGRLWTYEPPIPALFAPVIWGPSGWITHWDSLTHGNLHAGE